MTTPPVQPCRWPDLPLQRAHTPPEAGHNGTTSALLILQAGPKAAIIHTGNQDAKLLADYHDYKQAQCKALSLLVHLLRTPNSGVVKANHVRASD